MDPSTIRQGEDMPLVIVINNSNPVLPSAVLKESRYACRKFRQMGSSRLEIAPCDPPKLFDHAKESCLRSRIAKTREIGRLLSWLSILYFAAELALHLVGHLVDQLC
jgi:hypothetical protein